MRISFSGHETFVCRQFWLKKGYDFIKSNKSFNDEDAVVNLGVGKNMTTSIKFWLKAFNILEEDGQTLTKVGDFILNDKDPYLEDNASLWLLHYYIIKSERVFIFNTFFNQFLKEKNEFTKAQLISYLKRKTDEHGQKHFSEKTYDSDVNVFLRTYNRANDGKADIEEETANLLIELNLIRPFIKPTLEGKAIQWFKVLREGRDELPAEILSFAIQDTFGEEVQSITFKDLLDGFNSPGNIFCFTEKGLENKLIELSQAIPTLYNFNETAGNRVLQIKTVVDKWKVLDKYYE
jgi:hypothetical protein